ncbi:hypothetical protein [Anaeromyxobacter paludicola]|uniref:Uncharacterized protein n=1 Tax=Anaeromyxobacter paludicola TaxID=2918171 RepID=A0ABM7XDK6_9BACT|nr:hypothetical protein [Anaeromyxobacter paludicola]BDG09949.1 hypothetical protein AMPC_30620 [Anaeromyxobacter paludicola]
MSTSALLLALLAAAPPGTLPRKKAAPAVEAAPALQPPAPRKPHRHAPGRGEVRYVTAHRAYLDAGGRDGLQPGQTLALTRNGRPAGSCEVEAVSPDHATCTGPGLRPGDAFALAAPPPPSGTAPARLPPPLAPAETAARQAALAAAPFPRIEWKGTPSAPRPAGGAGVAEVTVSHALWSSTGATAWNRERLDAALRGADLGAGYRLYADLSAIHETTRPDDARFRPGDRTQLYVWEAEVALREPERPWAVAVGRVLPWRIPGATLFDGAQLGWKGARGEIGIFGGGVPDLATTEPTTKRSTAGVYLAQDGQLGPAWTRGQARLALVSSPELGSRFEGEALAQAVFGRDLDLAASARVGAGGNVTAPALLDLVRLDLSARPLERLSVSASYRYEGLATPDLAAPARFPGPSRHGDASLTLDPWGWVSLTAQGGLADDLTSGLSRQWVGPEVSVPRAFGRRGGVSAGYQEEFGWLAGRSVYLQAVTRPTDGLRLLARTSYESAAAPAGATDGDVALYLSGSADLASWLSIRLSALGRVSTQGGQSALPAGLAGTLGLSARD